MSSEFRIPAVHRRSIFNGVANDETKRTDPCLTEDQDWSFGIICIKTKILDIISESVESSFGDKRYVLRVSEVEGKIFNPCRLDKVGDYNHSPERDVVGDSEEEKDLESDDQFSDEDQLISSDDRTQVGFSDEEDEQFHLDDDADSVVQGTVFEDAINASPAHAGEKMEGHATVDDVNEASDTPNTPKMAVGKATDPEIRSCACVTNEEPGNLNMSQKKFSNGFLPEYSSPNEYTQPTINPIEPNFDTTQPVIYHQLAEINNSDAISEDSTTCPNNISFQKNLDTNFVLSQLNIVEQNRVTPTEEESSESKENRELKENVINPNLQGVSDRLKMLLDKNTPIKAKIEGGEVMQKKDNNALIKKKKKSVDASSGNHFQRITRNQSRRNNVFNGVVGNKEVASSSEISENSFISLGILQQMEEMGDFCGFSRRSGNGKG
ncbi:hypothetical protein L1887_39302 [Cichorium endivia]|nr:hypothetical protein L1887_39302 [Cichorium endivia]